MITMMLNGVPTQLTMEEYNKHVADMKKNLNIDPETGKIKSYKHEDLDKVIINGQEFTGIGYQGLMTVNTKTYVTEPTRSNDGSIENINDYDTFVVPRCKVNFKYFSLDDYMRLCEAVQPNEFVVEYYDKQFNTRVSHNMYCEPEEMAKLYNVGTSVIGVLDYEVSFIGTLNNLKNFEVQYDANGGTIKDLSTQNNGNYSASVEYSKGQRVYWNGNYYEAIFQDTTFNKSEEDHKTSEPPNTAYWELITPTFWNDSKVYKTGDVVYTTYTQNNEVKYKYFEAISDNFSGYLTTNVQYWKSITIKQYSQTKTYRLGEYCYTGGGSVLSSQFYKAIYNLTTFTGISPDNVSYWKLLPILKPQTVKWGQSIILADQDDLFAPPENQTSKDKWRINDTKNYYLPNQPINVFRTLKLYAEWGV